MMRINGEWKCCVLDSIHKHSGKKKTVGGPMWIDVWKRCDIYNDKTVRQKPVKRARNLSMILIRFVFNEKKQAMLVFDTFGFFSPYFVWWMMSENNWIPS